MAPRAGMLRAAPLALPLLLLGAKALSCPYTIREIGFAPLKREPYRLCLLVGEGNERLARLFLSVSSKALKDCNVVAEVIEARRGKAHPALHLARGAKLPALVLLSPWGTALTLAESLPPSEEAVRRAVEEAVSSPAREEMKQHVIRDWCVVLLVEGREGRRNEEALREIKEACRRIEGQTTEMGVVVRRGPFILRLRAEEVGRERVLLWSLGLLGKAGSEPIAVVLFGRGQQIGPTFEGEEIRSAQLLRIFRVLGGSCSCTTDLAWLSGRKVPLRWDYATRRMACEVLGFDPESPQVASSLASVGINVDNPDACRRALVNYTEAPLEEVMGSEDETPTVSLADVASGGTKAGGRKGERVGPPEGPSRVKREEALLGYREFVVEEGGYREAGTKGAGGGSTRLLARRAPLVSLPTPTPPQRQVFTPPEEKLAAAGGGESKTSPARATSPPMAPEAMRAPSVGRTATKAFALTFLGIVLLSGLLGLTLILAQKRRGAL